MNYQVEISDKAFSDLISIHQYISLNYSPTQADEIMGNLQSACASLYTYPNRGPRPKEMLLLGIKKYRELLYKPYRIVYRVAKNKVYVVMIADGRRDLPTLLHERLYLRDAN